MDKNIYQRQLDALRTRRQNLKTNHQNKINYLRRQIQTENESYARQMQSLSSEEQRLMNAKRNCAR